MKSALIDFQIRLSPSQSLHLDLCEIPAQSDSLDRLYQAFQRDWRSGWFLLASEKGHLGSNPSCRFWQEIAVCYLTRLCHLPPDVANPSVNIPEVMELQEWVIRAPPMIGGEYLSINYLQSVWLKLNEWVSVTVLTAGGISAFFSNWAPKWQQVGRVCFHLAENKKDPDRPFAFLATYSTGFGADGQLRHLPLKEALKQYSGSDNRQALIKLLTPIHNASKQCQWVEQLLSTSEIFQPLAWTPDKAYKFLSSIPRLEDSGLSVRIPNWWKRRSRPQVSVSIGAAKGSLLSASSMLQFDVKLCLGDEILSAEELEQLMSCSQNLVQLRGQWLEVDRDKLSQALDHWKQVQKSSKHGEISFIEGMRLLAGTPQDLHQKAAGDENQHWVRIVAGDSLSLLLAKLRDPSQLPLEKIDHLNASLRPYQNEGVNWLYLLSGLGLGACLADDMGLGKTLQILSLLLFKKQQRVESQSNPSLLIVPASLMGNWSREKQKFTPSLNLLLLHPSEMDGAKFAELEQTASERFSNFDLIVTTYSMVTRLQWLSKLSWDLLILDEAQAIKNSGAKQTQAIKGLISTSRIALTGTPIENRLSDLWSLFDFLNPGLLGSAKKFKQYIDYLEAHPNQFESLRKLTSPYILRRMKTDPKIISDLPQKIETDVYCSLTKQQAQFYQSVINELAETLKTIDSKGRRGAVLKTLLELKQICNHPSQYSGNGLYAPADSGKFERLKEICEELALRQEKVLIFTQFSQIMVPLEAYLSKIFGRSGLVLHGGTPIQERKNLVELFQNKEGPPFFLLSLKAGGTGLTLTEASHVIHFDRWWNPAVENQATDRAFRIGQKKNVQVHKFITQGTVEGHIAQIIASKQKLANDVLASTEEIAITELPDDQLLSLLALDLEKAIAK